MKVPSGNIRTPAQAASTWPGNPAHKTPSACNDDRNTWRVFHRDIPGRIIAEFYGDKAEEAAKEFCRLAAK